MRGISVVNDAVGERFHRPLTDNGILQRVFRDGIDVFEVGDRMRGIFCGGILLDDDAKGRAFRDGHCGTACLAKNCFFVYGRIIGYETRIIFYDGCIRKTFNASDGVLFNEFTDGRIIFDDDSIRTASFSSNGIFFHELYVGRIFIHDGCIRTPCIGSHGIVF